MKNSIKREQSQACLNFAERKNFRLQAKHKILMTLALLLTAVTGAWAITDPNAVYWDSQTWSEWKENVTTHTVGDITITATGSGKVYQSTSSGEPLAMEAGNNDAITFTSNGKPFASVAIITADELNVAGWTYNSSTWSYEWSGTPSTSVTLSGCNIKADAITFTFGTAEAPITVEWNASTKTGTFAMPAFDVVLTPIYAKAAAFATTGTEPEVKTLLPEAAEGIIAGTDASLIAEGTGIVAFAGTSTEVTQGQVMYFATTDAEMTAEKAAQANGWLATVPTAEGYDDAQTVYVWYYIKGADTPEGQTATAENTFNDSEICTEPITVNVLSNKFDIQFKAANDNTIETGKATVTVGGTAATVTEGKLEDVKMGTEVKVTAKDGYKFRKVEVKKGAPTTTVTWNSSDFYFDENPYTKDGVTLTPSIMGAASGNNLYEYGDNTFTTTLGKFIKIEIVFRDYSSPVIDGWTKETAGQYQPSPEQLPDFWADIYKLTWTGNADSVTLKGKDVYGILSITFTIQ